MPIDAKMGELKFAYTEKEENRGSHDTFACGSRPFQYHKPIEVSGHFSKFDYRIRVVSKLLFPHH